MHCLHFLKKTCYSAACMLQAYKKVSHKDQPLPGLTDFTNDQLFFIAFGQVYIHDLKHVYL